DILCCPYCYEDMHSALRACQERLRRKLSYIDTYKVKILVDAYKEDCAFKEGEVYEDSSYAYGQKFSQVSLGEIFSIGSGTPVRPVKANSCVVEGVLSLHCRNITVTLAMSRDLQQPHAVKESSAAFQTSRPYFHQDVAFGTRKLKLDDTAADGSSGDSTNYYSKEQKEDLLYDFEKAVSSIKEWKAHIMRTANQERAKQDIMDALDSSSVLILMDWAMKFLQLRYREKQSEWYGKRGLSWHISSVVFRDEESGKLRVTSYAHLFNKCTQDWYAVASIIENLFQYLKNQNPLLCKAYLRSDEAGCYHNNNLIGAMKDIGKRVGITIERYDYSEPHSGKDICDRIICPLKTSIRTYCCEGHDILTATDMRDALQRRPVKGTTASVNVVDESKQALLMKKLSQFSSYHNFKFDDSGVKAWKAYTIGQGKSFPYSSMYVTQQGPTQLETKEDFFESAVRERDLKNKKSVTTEKENASPCLFECNVPGCTQIFDSCEMLEKHLDVGKHIQVAKRSVYDTIRKDWATKFQSVDRFNEIDCFNLFCVATRIISFAMTVDNASL
ncbi:hypothetical protein AC249_AIPGENE19513, partial [Paramuricea clavata]